MLFQYVYVPHSMDRMQRFINFIFFQVWCRAPKMGDFSLNLFDANPPLKEIMVSLDYGDTQAGDKFYTQIQQIYESFRVLSRFDISQFKRWYLANNDIERVCANDSKVRIVRYAEIELLHPDLTDKLASFFKSLYSKQLLDLKVIREKIGEIDEHYRAFMTANSTGKCPFCGITDMLGVYHTKREAYDHYLPKALYPFNSINFKNLVPACHYCNSSYKTTNDPSYTPKDPAGSIQRRKAFYPYSAVGSSIEIEIELNNQDVDSLRPDDIKLSFGPLSVSDEIETWKDVYGIEERYKAKCCGNNDGKAWLTQMLDEWQNDNRSPSEFLTSLSRQAKRSPFADCNFLKKAFLEGCNKAGLLRNQS